jgi:hypothetical protein
MLDCCARRRSSLFTLEPRRLSMLPYDGTGGRFDSMLLSQDASPVEQTHDEEHDRDQQDDSDGVQHVNSPARCRPRA